MEQKKPTNRTGKKPASPAKPAAGKPSAKPKPAGKKQSSGGSATEYVFGWLGRQVGHVKKAVQTDVAKTTRSKPRTSADNKPSMKKPSTPPPAAAPQGASASEKVIYRQDKIEEAELPHQPGVILRRTIIDEVVVERVIEVPPKES